MGGFQSGFWKEFIITMVAVIFLLVMIPFFLRRWMGADKKKLFANSYINGFHEKVDWILRTIFVVLLIAGAIIFTAKPFVLLVMLFVFTECQLGFQSYVEWKFADNRQNFKVSLIEIILMPIAPFG